MEALFDLIFGNLAFLIVIIGGVISFLKRANENQNNNRQNQNQNRKQTQTPMQTQTQKRYQPAKDKRVKPFIPQLDDLFGEITKHLEGQTQKQQPTVFIEEKKTSEMNTNIEVVEPPVTHNNKNKRENETIEIDIKDINRKKAIEGVIWGEILGPPRARKKHSYSYLKRG